MLKVRNELAHDYDGEIVKEHCQTIVQTYIDLFYDFEKTVKKAQDLKIIPALSPSVLIPAGSYTASSQSRGLRR